MGGDTSMKHWWVMRILIQPERPIVLLWVNVWFDAFDGTRYEHEWGLN